MDLARAFDRIYICDFFFNLADRFIKDCMQRQQSGMFKNAASDPESVFVLGKSNGIAAYVQHKTMTGTPIRHDIQITRAWSYFRSLRVACLHDVAAGCIYLELQCIYANADHESERGNGYIYAVLQGLKMAAIVNHEIVDKAFERKRVKIVVSTSWPAVDTTLFYLQGRESYPPDAVASNYTEGENFAE